jgi:hypothetical protein
MKKIALLSLLAAVAAAASVPAGATPFTTDEVRAELAQRHAELRRAAELQPLPDAPRVRVTDTETARAAAAQATAREAHERRLAQVLRAGAGLEPAMITVTDTDSARAAAARQHREQSLLANYAAYIEAQQRSASIEPCDTAVRQ